MTGLAGIAALDGQLDTTGAMPLVETMGRIQSHREPDGWRVVARPGLIHVVSSRNGEPLETDSGLSLVFDGMISNGSSVREEILRTGTKLRTGTDHELVLRAWERWGAKCLDRLNGRFAFVVHDAKRGSSHLVRDRFGHKPFYYALQGNRVYFASEIKTLNAVVSAPVLNEMALMEWSLYGDVLAPRTLFRGIHALPDGHLLEVGTQARKLESQAYYDVMNVVDPVRYADLAARSPAEIMRILDETLDRVVRGQIEGQRGDVGVLLSGGVDSAVIAAFAARHAKVKGYNFSARRDSVLDERRMAERVAKKLGLPLQGVYLDAETYRRELPRATYLHEMPIWHYQIVPVHMLARLASSDGVRLMLSGVNVGTLLLASDDRYRWVVRPPFMAHVPSSVMRVARKAVYSASDLPVANPFFVENLGFGLRLVDSGARSKIVARCDEAYQFLRDLDERRIHVMRLSDTIMYFNRFFRQGDNMCMGESVEHCDAAVDTEFVSLALNLRTDLIFRKKVTKWILKELGTRYLSREIAFQKKHPVWNLPVDQYFLPMFKQSLHQDGFLASFMGLDWQSANDLYNKEKNKEQILYRLVNIEIWGRLFFMGQSVDEVTSLFRQ